jgi:SAM-dependent methyltransferase
VLDALPRCDLPALLEHYWSLSDSTPPELRPQFIASALRGERRGKLLFRALTGSTFERPAIVDRVLEIGSGTGGFLAAAVEQGVDVVGTDIAMRWLHVSRRRFLDKGIAPPPLVCCCAEFLPFRTGTFDAVVSASTLEFVRSRGDVLAECARTLRGDGSLLVQTVNRYSLAVDPYSRLRGVGYLPRAWQARYVRWRRGADYENIRPLSCRELGALAARRFRKMEWAFTDVDEASLRQFSWTTRLQVRAYRKLQRLPAARGLLRHVGPEWLVKLSGPLKQPGVDYDND